MQPNIDNAGSRMVEPRRKRKRTPSDVRREAKRNADRIMAASRMRNAAYSEGGHPNVTAALSTDLDIAFHEKAKLRVEVRDELRMPEAVSYRPGIPGGRPE